MRSAQLEKRIMMEVSLFKGLTKEADCARYWPELTQYGVPNVLADPTFRAAQRALEL